MRRDKSLWINWPNDGDDEPTRVATPQSDTQAHERPPAPRPRPRPAAPDPDDSPKRKRSPLAVVAIALLAIAIGAFGIGALTGDDGGGSDGRSASATTAAPLEVEEGTVPQTSTSKLYAKASGAVVQIRARSGSSVGSGTGFLIDDKGTVVTNAHVVGSATEVEIRFDRDAQANGRVLGTDSSTDLAVVRVPTSSVEGIEPLKLADSTKVRVGDRALAIGFPLGLDKTATQGIVSGVGRQIEAPNGFSIDKVIQTDAPINPGNSGGPLLDTAGRVIGVNSQIATAGGGGGNVGIGFAVPAETVREVVPQLVTGGAIARPWLGVSTADPSALSGSGIPGGGSRDPGATIADLTPGGPAEGAGLRVGDRITSIDGTRITGSDGVATAVGRKAPGDRIAVQVDGPGGERTVDVTLGTRPERVGP